MFTTQRLTDPDSTVGIKKPIIIYYYISNNVTCYLYTARAGSRVMTYT